MINYVRKLHVKNIGLFDFLEVEFSPKMNIIIGANGSGKTSILRYLTFCFSNRHLHTLRFRKGAEYWINAIFEGNPIVAGTTNIIDNNQDYRQFNAVRWDKIPNENHNELHLPHDNVPYNLLAIGANRFFDYQKIRGMQQEKKGKERKKEYDQKNTTFLDKPELPAIKQWMINRYFIIDKEWSETEKENWNRIINYLPKLAPKHLTFKFERIERDLEPLFSVNNKICYLEELSSGLKSILSIVFSIVDWCEGINENKKGLVQNATGTVLIDEIDAHLHPEWQRNITCHLKELFPNLQFIVTTHSPHIVATAESNEVIIIPEHTGSVKLKAEEKNFKGWQLDFILEDLMNIIDKQELLSDELLDNLDKALSDKNIENFDKEIEVLKSILHPNDPIVKVYQLKRNQLLLNK